MSVKRIVNDCPICLDPLVKTRKIYITSCGHTFHKTCFQRLLTSTCPCCRKEEVPTIDHNFTQARNRLKTEREELKSHKNTFRQMEAIYIAQVTQYANNLIHAKETLRGFNNKQAAYNAFCAIHVVTPKLSPEQLVYLKEAEAKHLVQVELFERYEHDARVLHHNYRLNAIYDIEARKDSIAQGVEYLKKLMTDPEILKRLETAQIKREQRKAARETQFVTHHAVRDKLVQNI